MAKKADLILVRCDGKPKELWEKCLILCIARTGQDLNPACALVALTGCTHDEAREAFKELCRRETAGELAELLQ